MKKLSVVLAMLLLLLAWLFFGNIPSWTSRSASRPELPGIERRDRVAVPRHDRPTGDSRSRGTLVGTGDSADAPRPKEALHDLSMGLVDQEELSPLPQTGPIDGILFIRSSRVFEGEDPGPEEIARLQRTIGVLEKVDPRKRMILDADAVSSSRTPLVLYANPEFDVTSHVTKIFRRFLEFEDSIKRIEDRQDKSQK